MADTRGLRLIGLAFAIVALAVTATAAVVATARRSGSTCNRPANRKAVLRRFEFGQVLSFVRLVRRQPASQSRNGDHRPIAALAR